MKSIFLALLASASLAVAAPNESRNYGYCISQADAELVASRYAAVISGQASDLGDAVTTAQAIAARNYVEQSDSANILGGLPLGQPTVEGKQNWIFESQNNPPFPTITLEVFTGGCNKVVWRWISTSFGSAAYPVQGIHIFTVNGNGRITTVQFEFNSFAAGLDTGYTIFYANGTQYGV